jgi:hypothetical protein
MQDRLNAELNKILAIPDIAKRIESIGGEVKAAPVIKDAGIKVQ